MSFARFSHIWPILLYVSERRRAKPTRGALGEVDEKGQHDSGSQTLANDEGRHEQGRAKEEQVAKCKSAHVPGSRLTVCA
jgi:hypothetical protein